MMQGQVMDHTSFQIPVTLERKVRQNDHKFSESPLAGNRCQQLGYLHSIPSKVDLKLDRTNCADSRKYPNWQGSQSREFLVLPAHERISADSSNTGSAKRDG